MTRERRTALRKEYVSGGDTGSALLSCGAPSPAYEVEPADTPTGYGNAFRDKQ
jgi:hypothetical protein